MNCSTCRSDADGILDKITQRSRDRPATMIAKAKRPTTSVATTFNDTRSIAIRTTAASVCASYMPRFSQTK